MGGVLVSEVLSSLWRSMPILYTLDAPARSYRLKWLVIPERITRVLEVGKGAGVPRGCPRGIANRDFNADRYTKCCGRQRGA